MARKLPPAPPIETSLDRQSIVFEGDSELRQALQKSRDLQEFWREIGTMGPPPDRRIDLLKRSIRLTPGLAPRLFHCIEHCRKVLGLQTPIDAFCQQDALTNAFVIPARDGRITLCFTSAALESLDDGELCSVIGHELGHVLFEHHAMRPLLLFREDERLAPIDAMRIYAWMRYAELTADRVGLLCCDDFDTAISAEFKMVSGLRDPRFLGNLRDTTEQYTSLTAEELESSEEDWFSTHPYSPLRIRALDLFHQSKTFRKLRGRGEGKLSEAELERQVASLLDLMNPSALNDRVSCRKESREFLVYGGVEVALADERMSRRELSALKNLVGDGKVLDSIDEARAMNEDERGEKLLELQRTLRVHLSLTRRRKLIEDLAAIAWADNRLHDQERESLYWLAGGLGVQATFVDEALARPEGAID
ncbi:MAG: M48 family metallopeptidase [Polyangiaceae bacterium]|nr:M48 family metallopeptidase [Polyangiaceae bacterium]